MKLEGNLAYRQAARWYDTIYSFKDYAAEAESLRALLAEARGGCSMSRETAARAVMISLGREKLGLRSARISLLPERSPVPFRGDRAQSKGP